MKFNTKLYKYDSNNLTYVKVPYIRKYIIYGTMLVGLFFSLKVAEHSYHYFIDAESVLLVEQQNEFTEEKFIDKIKELNFKFPHIVLAQAKLESGNYTSKIFRENNNLFGMKEAKTRLNLAQGTQYGHAYYVDWEQSLLDYALYSATYYSKCSNEDQYYQLLDQSYAEGDQYINKLRAMVANEKLKDKFK